MKRLFICLLSIALMTSCTEQPVNNVQIQSAAIPGFNVQNFAQLIKTTADPAKIERDINDSNNTVNNLDLNKDGRIDFLTVNETDKTIQIVDNDVNPGVTVCTMTVSPQGNNQAAVNIQGSQQYCGNDYSYHSNFTLTDFLLLNYLMTPHHSYYYPHYVYGYHPYYYHPYYYHPYGSRSYRTVTRSYTTITHYGTSRRTASYGSSRSSYRSSLSNPIRSQRSFSVNKSYSSGYRSSSFGSPRSSFGSSRSSFGGRKR